MNYLNSNRIHNLRSKISRKYKIFLSAITSLAVVAFTISPLFYGISHAYGYPTQRSIEMSSSAASATSVTYQISLTPSVPTNTVINGIVVDFCNTDPIPSDSCAGPTGFSVTSTALSVSPNSGGYTGGIWTLTALTSGSMEAIALTSSAPATWTAGPITFTITGFVNPSTPNTTFYGRLLTYAAASGATSYTSTAIGTPLDAGGVAISTTNVLVITSRVQEQLSFCVWTSSLCSGSTISLGNAGDVLSSLGPYVDTTAHYTVQSNADGGVVISMVGGVLTSGTNTIEASSLSGMGASAASDYASITGSPQFGVCNFETSGITITPAAPYADINCGNAMQSSGTGTPGGANSAMFAFNITNAGGPYGDVIANAVAGASATAEMNFIANISTSTVAGIYSTSLNFVATGTY